MRSSKAHKTTIGRIPILDMISKEASRSLFTGSSRSRFSAQGARWREMFTPYKGSGTWKEFTSSFHYIHVPSYENIKGSARTAAYDLSKRIVDFMNKSKPMGLIRVSPCYSYIHDDSHLIGYQVKFFVWVPPTPKALPTPKAHTPHKYYVKPAVRAKFKAKKRIRHKGKFVYLVDWRR